MLYTRLIHPYVYFFFFFFNDTATTEIYTLSLHDALPILHHQSDAVVMVRDDLGKTRRQVGIQAEAIQSPGAHTAEAAGVDGDQDVQMLVFAELPGDQRAGACRCLPVDPGERVATHVAAQLVQLRARTRDTPRARAARESPPAHPAVQRIGSHPPSLLRG